MWLIQTHRTLGNGNIYPLTHWDEFVWFLNLMIPEVIKNTMPRWRSPSTLRSLQLQFSSECHQLKISKSCGNESLDGEHCKHADTLCYCQSAIVVCLHVGTHTESFEGTMIFHLVKNNAGDTKPMTLSTYPTLPLSPQLHMHRTFTLKKILCTIVFYIVNQYIYNMHNLYIIYWKAEKQIYVNNMHKETVQLRLPDNKISEILLIMLIH